MAVKPTTALAGAAALVAGLTFLLLPPGTSHSGPDVRPHADQARRDVLTQRYEEAATARCLEAHGLVTYAIRPGDLEAHTLDAATLQALMAVRVGDAREDSIGVTLLFERDEASAGRRVVEERSPRVEGEGNVVVMWGLRPPASLRETVLACLTPGLVA
jgi:hypothetical protein